MEYVTLNNWINMPMLWFWVYKVAQNEAKNIVLNAINTWYRLIDTAQYYENERWVWQAIRASWINRREFFVTTKLITKWYDNTLKWMDISLQKFWYDYFDLILIHWPKWDNISIYKALETAYTQWKCRAIWLSNFNEEQFLEVYENCKIKPVVNQIETHVMWQQWKMHDFLLKYDCIHESRSPLWAWKFWLFENEILIRIAEKYDFTDVQYALFYRKRTLSASEYRTLIGTYSDHIAMEESIREKFFDEIEKAINRYGGVISVFDTIDLQLARKP